MAGEVHVRTSADLDAWTNKLERLRDVRSLVARVRALTGAEFADTQQVVHVITGSLKASGRSAVDYDDTAHTLTADIGYGGPSPGSVNDPVVYAWYEQRRGGAHDYMAGVELDLAQVIAEWWAEQ